MSDESVRFDINMTMAEATLFKVAADNIGLPIEYGHYIGARASRAVIAKDQIELWWRSRDEMRFELRALGMPYKRAVLLVLDFWRSLEPLRNEAISPRAAYIKGGA